MFKNYVKISVFKNLVLKFKLCVQKIVFFDTIFLQISWILTVNFFNINIWKIWFFWNLTKYCISNSINNIKHIILVHRNRNFAKMNMLVKNHNFKIKIKFEMFSKNRYCIFGKHIDFLKVPIFTKCDKISISIPWFYFL